MQNRREFLRNASLATAGIVGALPFSAHALATGSKARGHVVVVGGGFGGATAAKYLRMWSNGAVDVTLIERDAEFVSCPMSNLVIGGLKQLSEITVSYANLRDRHGVRVMQDEVVAIDAAKGQLRLAKNGTLDYDRLILSPGIDFMTSAVGGLEGNQDAIPHAWKAGPQTALLRSQLESMRDGGVFAMHIPKAPYRCPPGPYERACMVANYLKTAKPRSKVLILDANGEIQSKKALFTKAFETHYKGILEYRPNNELRSVDAKTLTAELDFESVKADVLNIIPPQRAGGVTGMLEVPQINDRWVDVDWLTMGAKGVDRVHVIGDALFPAPTMPKSGHMANQQAKVAVAAVLNLLAGEQPSDQPVVMNTCYSFVDPKNVVHVASVHQYNAQKKIFLPVEGAGGLSPAANELEGKYAFSWAKNIWADMLA